MLSLQEVEYTDRAANELRAVDWTDKLLQRFDQNGGSVSENMPLMFEVRFAYELYLRGVEAQYEYSAGVEDSTIDFRVMSPQEWLIELVSVRESQGLQAATEHHGFFWSRQLSSDARDERQSEEAEMIVALAKITEKVYSAGKPTKFPMPSSAFHIVVVDMRGYLGEGGDGLDYSQMANGALAIPEQEAPARRFWRGEPIRGLFERVDGHPLKGATVAQKRIHFLAFVAESEFREGEIARTLQFRPNPHLLTTRDRVQTAYRSFPLAYNAA